MSHHLFHDVYRLRSRTGIGQLEGYEQTAPVFGWHKPRGFGPEEIEGADTNGQQDENDNTPVFDALIDAVAVMAGDIFESLFEPGEEFIDPVLFLMRVVRLQQQGTKCGR